ncbi:MAG: class I SAM-dependent methyltransferase [Candidatus Dormibacteraeota bacterium]|uniref:SAM-dependent methyltransferase n=1 Tax=Candidatus Aeolococcus gillhamiae TaxID=3127015 RepID=A0A2W6B148_9BACT|nr:class I SAM-dependent methyltransferase [Candidatus Dormibacteraeota bacterium]PZR84141.1 MAG: SAM-dependent methyltransferase [Candidatus Dormibacter sp. RRmetagenome_bin12]
MADDAAPPPTFASFDSAYLGTPPWEIGKPQPALAALFAAGEVSGRVLDVGCGTGELALLAASRGLDATGVDSAPRAIDIARARAAERGLTGVRFEVGDALDLNFLNARFDTVLDSGVFHGFSDEDRARYVESIRRVLVPGGKYHLAVFSDAQPGDWGPRRVRREELNAAFAHGWELRRVEPVTFEVNLDDGVVQAWRATALRI